MNDKQQVPQPHSDRLGVVANLLKSIAAITAAAGSILATLYALGFFSGDNDDAALRVQPPPAIATLEPSETVIPETVQATVSPLPEIYNVHFCDRPCEEIGAVRISSAPEKTKMIYVQWSYRNMREGMKYTRVWSMDGREWIRYECTWQGPEEGMFNIALKEPMGLHSGTWVMTTTTEDRVLTEASIPILGDYDYWDPAGYQVCPDFLD
jgi:hypothetical protein